MGLAFCSRVVIIFYDYSIVFCINPALCVEICIIGEKDRKLAFLLQMEYNKA